MAITTIKKSIFPVFHLPDSRRVCLVVDFAEVFDRDFGVDGGGVEAFVAEELLDEADVGSIF